MGNWLVVQIINFWNFLNFKIFQIRKLTNFQNFTTWKINKLRIFTTCETIKIPKTSKIWNYLSIRYFAPFGILPVVINDINEFWQFIFSIFIFYSSNSRRFCRFKFERSLIFQFEISTILKFYCSKFQPSPKIWYTRCVRELIFFSQFKQIEINKISFKRIYNFWVGVKI